MNKTKKVGIALILSASLGYASYYLKELHKGSAPTKSYADYSMEQARETLFNDELKALYDKAHADDKDIDAWKALANGLASMVAANPEAPQTLVMELVQSLRHILDLDPNDPNSLLNMANVSYNYQVFDKAAQYYELYLKFVPNDIQSRATYASALSFIQEHDRAESELLRVLNEKPDYFLALANRAINFAFQGDKQKTEAAVKKAVAHAPNNDAKEKFTGFIDRLLNPEQPKESQAQPNPTGSEHTRVDLLVDFVKANPVAGPKFAYSALPRPNSLELYFSKFPMEQMPPFAKQKFLGGIQAKAKELGLSGVLNELLFLDADSKNVMEKLEL